MLIKNTHLALASLSLLAHTGLAIAQPCITLNKLSNPSSVANDSFGFGVGMSFGGPNNLPLLAVGRPGKDAPGSTDVGGWSVYQRNTNGAWVLMHDAVNVGGDPGERAGAAIAIADPYMIVGAPEYGFRGRVRMLRRTPGSNAWTIEDDINPGVIPGSTDSIFGNNVAITAQDGGWAIVGAPRFSETSANSGAIYTFYRTASGEWINRYSQRGEAFFGRENGYRGASVAVSQTTPWFAWGAPEETTNEAAQDDGVAYVMSLVGTTPTTLVPPVTEAGQQFGGAVAVEGTWLAIGAAWEDGSPAETGLANNVLNSGVVYLYENVSGTWFYRSQLRAPVAVHNGRFGGSLSMSGSQLLVTELGTRRLYVYRRDGATWTLQSSFLENDDPTDETFGFRIAIRDGQIAANDPTDDANGTSNAGAVYTASVAPTLTSGDTCSNPLPMPTTDFVGCTENATPSAGTVTTCGLGGSGQGPDVWFRFQPACDGNAIIDTFGSDFDTVLSVHSQCPNASTGNSIVCNDDSGFAAPNNRASLLTFNFQGGSTYLIRVSGYNAASGQFTLRSLLSYGVSNDTCATAPTVAAGSYNFNTCSATDSAGPVPLGTVRDIWYRFIAPATASYNFTTCGTGFNTVITLFSGTQSTCPTSSAAMIAQNDNNGICNNNTTSLQSFLQTTLTQGQSVMIRVGGAAPGEFGPGVFGIGQPINCDDIDFNNNTVFPEDQDVIDFFNVLAGGECSPGNTCNDIDFNNNTVFPEDQDVIDFFNVLAGGTCS